MKNDHYYSIIKDITNQKTTITMNWLIFAILAAGSYGFYNFFAKISTDKFSPVIAAAFITGFSFLVTIAATIYLKISGQNLIFSKNTILYPILAGLFVGAAEIFYMITFSKNAPLSIATPLVIGGAAFIATLLGIFFLRENLSATKIFAILLTIIGLFLLAKN